jgi:hypothetical protein
MYILYEKIIEMSEQGRKLCVRREKEAAHNFRLFLFTQRNFTEKNATIYLEKSSLSF